MRARRLGSIVLCGFVVVGVLAPAVGAQVLRAVSFDDAVASALERHPSVTAAARALDAAQAKLVQAKASAAVLLSVGARTSTGTLTTTGVATANPPTSSTTSSVDATLSLYDGGIQAAQVAQAVAAVEAAQASLEAARQDVSLSAAQAYFQVLRTTQVVAVREAALQSAQRQVAQAEALFRAGTAARADVVKAQATAASAEADLIAARGQVDLGMASLRNAMGLPLTQAIAVAEPPVLPALAFSPEQAAGEATAKRAEMVKAGADIRGAEAALRLAEIKAGVLVSVGVTGVAQITPRPGQLGWEVSATLSYPLADGGKTKAVLDEARANLAAAQAKAEVTSQQVQLQAFQAALTIREATARLSALNVAVAAAEESLRVAEGRYRAGVGILLDLLDAQTAATNAQINRVQADYDLRQAGVTLRHSIGRPVTDRRL